MAETSSAGENPYLIKHLEFIQLTITRMAANSFLIKGWAVTLVSAVLAFISKDGIPRAAAIAFLPTLMFWGLDAYYLRQERLYRKLYDEVRLRDRKRLEEIDFSMNTSSFNQDTDDWLHVALSRTIVSFYGVLGLLILLVWLVGPIYRKGAGQ